MKSNMKFQISLFVLLYPVYRFTIISGAVWLAGLLPESEARAEVSHPGRPLEFLRRGGGYQVGGEQSPIRLHLPRPAVTRPALSRSARPRPAPLAAHFTPDPPSGVAFKYFVRQIQSHFKMRERSLDVVLIAPKY